MIPTARYSEVVPLQPGEQAVERLGHGGADPQRLVEEAGEDDPEQRADRQFEAAESPVLELEDRERDHAGDQSGEE